nr:hypothetical protein [Candidatus Sigynarchaeota archaeon]
MHGIPGYHYVLAYLELNRISSGKIDVEDLSVFFSIQLVSNFVPHVCLISHVEFPKYIARGFVIEKPVEPQQDIDEKIVIADFNLSLYFIIEELLGVFIIVFYKSLKYSQGMIGFDKCAVVSVLDPILDFIFTGIEFIFYFPFMIK